MFAAFAVGTLGQYLTVVAVCIVAWIVYRGGGGAALGVLETANRILEKRVDELEGQRIADARMIAELKGRTDFVLALAPLSSSIDSHEERAAARFERSMVVLDLIASRLGPDNGNGAE